MSGAIEDKMDHATHQGVVLSSFFSSEALLSTRFILLKHKSDAANMLPPNQVAFKRIGEPTVGENGCLGF